MDEARAQTEIVGNRQTGITGLLSPGAKSTPSSISILALAEEGTVTGPAKNMFEFHRVCQERKGAPYLQMSMATFQRSRSLTGPAANANPFTGRAAELGIPLYGIAEGFRFDLRAVSHLRRLAQRIRPDVIETHHVKSHFLVRLSGLWKEIPWLAFHHGYTDTDFRSPLYNRLDRWSLPAAAQIITMNRGFQEQLVQRGIPRKRITLLHNAVRLPQGNDTSRFDAAVRSRKKADLGLSPEEKVILCVGRLSREKAQIDLVPVLQRLQQMRPNIALRLILVGEGPEQARISQAIGAAGLENSIFFAGQLKDVTPYYAAADCVAIPSLSEGSPNVLLEAMAFGVPVVATAVGGIPEIVTHGESALLVPSRSPGAMAEAMDLVLSNPGTAMNLAEQAARRVEKEHSPEARADALVEIYSTLCRSTRVPPSGEAIAN